MRFYLALVVTLGIRAHAFNHASNFRSSFASRSSANRLSRCALRLSSSSQDGRPEGGETIDSKGIDQLRLEDSGKVSDRDKPTGSPEVDSKNMIIEAVSSPLALGTAALAKTLVNPEDVTNFTLKPIHKWVISRRRVAAAVKAQELAKADGAPEETTKNRLSLMQLPSNFMEAYDKTLASAMETPLKLAASVRKTAEDLLEAPEKAQKFVQDVAATAQDMSTSAREVVEGVSTLPGKARGAVEAAVELGQKAEGAVRVAAAAYESLQEMARAVPHESRRLADAAQAELNKTSKALETLPSIVPTLIEVAAEDAEAVVDGIATGTLAGMEAAGAAAWKTTVELASPAVEGVVRQTLIPVHALRISVLRVQDAVKAEGRLLGPPSPRLRTPNDVGEMNDSAVVRDAPDFPGEAAGQITGVLSGAEARVERPLRALGSPVRGAWRRLWRRPRLRKIFALWRRKSGVKADGKRSDSSSSPISTDDVDEIRGILETSGALDEGVDDGLDESAPVSGGVVADAATETVTRPERGAVEPGRTVGGGRKVVLKDPRYGSVSSDDSTADVLIPTSLEDAIPSPSRNQGKTAGKSSPDKNDNRSDPPPKTQVRKSTTRSWENPVEAAAANSAEYAVSSPSFSIETLGGLKPPDETQATSTPVANLEAAASSALPTALVENRPRGVHRLPSRAMDTAGYLESLSPSNDTSAFSKGPVEGTPRWAPKFRRKSTPVSGVNKTESAWMVAETAAIASPELTIGLERREIVSLAPPSPVATNQTVYAPSTADEQAQALPSVEASRSSPKTEILGGVAAAEAPDGDRRVADQKVAEAQGDDKVAENTFDEMSERPESRRQERSVLPGDPAPGVSPSGNRPFQKGASPTEDFLREWVHTTVTQKKAGLKGRDSAIRWERHWYPVAIVADVRQGWRGARPTEFYFELLGREYELCPPQSVSDRPGGGHRWRCKAVMTDRESRGDTGESTEETSFPVRESSGLLWVWLDRSPEGLAENNGQDMAALFGCPEDGGTRGASTAPWARRLARRRRRDEPVKDRDAGTGGEARSRRTGSTFVVQEIPCGYTETVCGLLEPAHGVAVRTLSVNGRGTARAEARAGAGAGSVSQEGAVSSTNVELRRANSTGLKAVIDSASLQGDLSFGFPSSIRWRFVSHKGGGYRRARRPPFEEERPSATDGSIARRGSPSSSGRLMPWRKPGDMGGEERDDAGELGRGSGEGDEGMLRYWVAVSPVGPRRTKVFARLEIASRGPLSRLSAWWWRGDRHARLAAALEDVARASSRGPRASGGSRPSTAVRDWLETKIKSDPC